MAQRFDLRVNLWNSRQLAQVCSQDFFDRVKVLSPSLADCLLQRNQERVGTPDKSPNPETLEKLTFGREVFFGRKIKISDDYISQALPYLRSSVVNVATASLFVHKFQPKLRDIYLIDFNRDPNPIMQSKVFIKFAPQLQSFTYEGALPVDLLATGIMPRLKTLKFEIDGYPQLSRLKEFFCIDRAIPWNESTTFLFQTESGLPFDGFYPVLQYFDEMSQLRKLGIKLSFKEHNYHGIGQLDSNSMKAFLTTEFSKIYKFSKLEVLNFGVEPSRTDATLNYRFVLNLLVPKLGSSLKKLIFQVPERLESSSNCILLDYFNEFAQLETLMLKYPRGDANLLQISKYKRASFQSIRHLTIMDFNQQSLNSFFEQIPTIFPNLVELNLKAQEEFSGKDFYTTLIDRYASKMISRLVNLRILRFMDDHPKLACLYGSIELICKRATELKPKVPMLFRVPILDGELKHLKYLIDELTDELKQFDCVEKTDKWIRLC